MQTSKAKRIEADYIGGAITAREFAKKMARAAARKTGDRRDGGTRTERRLG